MQRRSLRGLCCWLQSRTFVRSSQATRTTNTLANLTYLLLRQIAQAKRLSKVDLHNANGAMMGLIRFGGHFSCEGYDVQTDGGHPEAASAPPVH